MKRILNFILCVALILTCLPLCEVSADGATPVSVPISISGNFNTRAFTDFDDSFTVAWNTIAASYYAAMSINSFKANSTVTWKNTWQTDGSAHYLDSDNANTLTWKNIDYNMVLNPSDLGYGAMGTGGGTNRSFNVTPNYYAKINLLSNGYTGLGYNGNTTSTLGIGVVLTYADGTQEYGVTNPMYYAMSNTIESAPYWNGFTVPNIYLDRTSGADANGTYKARSVLNPGSLIYMNPYEIAVNSTKKLTGINILGSNTAVTVTNGTATYSTVNSTHSAASIYAMSAVTTSDTVAAGCTANVTALLSALGNASELTYTLANMKKIDALNAAVAACTANSVILSSTVQTQINEMLLAWKVWQPISSSGVDISSGYTNNAYLATGVTTDSTTQLYNFTNTGINITAFKALNNSGGNSVWKNAWTAGMTNNTMTWNAVDFKLDVLQSAAAASTNCVIKTGNISGATKTFDFADGYYSSISILANTDIPKASMDNIDKYVGVVLTYGDGTEEFKESLLNVSGDPTSTSVSNWQGYQVTGVGCSNIYVNKLDIPVNSSKLLVSAKILSHKASASVSGDTVTVTVSASNLRKYRGVIFAISTVMDHKSKFSVVKSNIAALDTTSIDKVKYLSTIDTMESLSNAGFSMPYYLTNDEITKLNSLSLSYPEPLSAENFTAEKLTDGISVNAVIKNSINANGVTGTVIIALYDASNNMLLDSYLEDKLFVYNSAVPFTPSFDISNYTATSYLIRCFVWNSLTGLNPYMAPVSVTK